MHVRKRNGAMEPVNLTKIVSSLERYCGDLPGVDVYRIATKTVGGLIEGVSTRELDMFSVRTAKDLIIDDPVYSRVAARILANLIQKEVSGQDIQSFSQSIEAGHHQGLISDTTHALVMANKRKLNAAIKHERDWIMEYHGLQTVYDRYLLKHRTLIASEEGGRRQRAVIETPQYFFLRVACGLADDASEAIELYNLLSSLEYMASTPTLFNSGTTHSQMSSCYLNDSPLDSLDDIYKRYSDIALLSKFAGGIGVSLSRLRSEGSPIKGTNGASNGLVPWAHTLSASVGSVNQGGRRKGAACIYLETHHPDLMKFLELKDNTGEKEQRAYNLNLANWVPDLFMQRVKDDAMWSFFDTVVAPELTDLYGESYERRYLQLEAEGRYAEQMPARKVYSRMMRTLAETGNGWMCFKDASNRRGNQVNDDTGTVIHLSNLCVAPETMILTDKGEKQISLLRDEVVSVWNGHQFSPVIVRLTGMDKPLMHVVFDNGKTLDCTAYHKFFVCGEIGTYECRTVELQPGDRMLCVAEDTSQTFVKVVEVQDNYRRDDTYCFLEPQHHKAVFNGILAGNCTEILEVTSSGKRELVSRQAMATMTADDLLEQNIRVVGFDVHRDAFEVITGSECSVCNLGSINVGRGYVKHGKLDKDKLRKNVAIAVKYLDRVIDRNFYPIHEAEASNKRWRPVGLGLMGVADLFFQLRLPFESEAAIRLSAEIQEEIYFQALRTSCDLAKTLGAHRDFDLTRAAKGQLQFDLAGVTPSEPERWDALREEIMQHGLRNSLLIAVAPTATISHICGVEECIEPIKSNLLKRETLSGEFIAINRYLVEDLRKIGRWNADTISQLKISEGSIAMIPDLPSDMYETYKTVWEMSMKSIIAHGVARGAYIDQSHSLNMFIDLNRYPEDKRIGVLSSLYMHAWESGLKTTYYFRSRAATRIEQTTTRAYAPAIASENPEVCESCT